MTLWAAHAAAIPSSLEKDFYTLSQLDALPVPVAMRAACEFARKELQHEKEA